MKKKTGVNEIILLAIGILQILTPLVFFPVCAKQVQSVSGSMMPMKCHWFAVCVIVLGTILMAQTILRLFVHAPAIRLYGSASALVIGFATLVLTLNAVIGACENHQMMCRMGTLPAVRALGILTVMVSAIDVLRNCRYKERNL